MSTLLAIKNLIDQNYPDNTTGLITPALERQVLKALADFVVSSQGEVSTSGFVYDAAFTYDAGDPVIYDSAWYLSLVGSNLNNQPDESPTEWEAINAYNQVLSIYETGAVYIGELILVIRDGFLYQLDRAVVGDTPFVSTDFAAELAANKWVIFTGGEQGPPGADGADGREVEFQVSATHIQWRYVGDVTWINLIALSAITGADGAPGAPGTNGTNGADGADGREIELRTSGTWLQWRYVGDPSWTNLFDFSGLVAASDPPVDNSYANLSAMIADQANQVSGYIYFDGKSYYHYLGTTTSTIADYRRISPAPTPPVADSYASQAAMIADQSNQLSGYIYFDGASFWQYLGSTSGTIADYKNVGNQNENLKGAYSVKHTKTYFSDLSGYTASGFTPTYTNGKMVFTGGVGNFSRFLTINDLKNADENIEIELIFQVITLGFGVGIGKRSINPWWTNSNVMTFSPTQNTFYLWDSNLVTIIGSKVVPTVAVNDIIQIRFTQIGNIITCTYFNLTSGFSSQFSAVANLAAVKNFRLANSNDLVIHNNGGTNHIISIKVKSFSNYSPDILCIGDSKTAGYSATNASLRWASNISNLGPVIVAAGDGDRTVELVQTIGYTKLIKAKYVILCIGRNDLNSGVPSGTWQANYESVVSQLQEQGSTVIHLLPIPETVVSDQSALSSYIISTYGAGNCIDVATGWNNATMLSADNVHPNEVGHAFIAKKIIDSGLITPSQPVQLFNRNIEVPKIDGEDILKAITGYNAAVAQRLEHTSTGVLNWVNI